MVSSEGVSASPSPPAATATVAVAMKYGVTEPISMAGPTRADRQRSRDLEKVWILGYLLRKFNSLHALRFFFLVFELFAYVFWFLGVGYCFREILILYNIGDFVLILLFIYVYGFWV